MAKQRLLIRTAQEPDLWRAFERFAERCPPKVRLDYRPGEAIVALASEEAEARRLRATAEELLAQLGIEGTIQIVPRVDDEPAPPWVDERRLVVSSTDEQEQARVEELLQGALPTWAGVHREKDSPLVALYAPDDQHARTLRVAASNALSAAGLDCTIEIQRWNPDQRAWQEASLPVPDRPRPPELPHSDECKLEIVTILPWEHATGLRDEAEASGMLAVAGGRTLRIAVRDDRELDAAKRWIQTLPPKWGVLHPEVHEITAFRHWQWRQWVFGNYGGGATAGPANPAGI